MKTVFETNFPDIKLLRKGKVREVYEVEDYILFVASDRISAFDVIMNEPVPGKGALLSSISKFWFEITTDIIPNHFISDNVNNYPEVCKKYADELEGRSMLVKKATPLPVEFVVRGYIAGSGWKEYQETGKITGIKLPEGLQKYDKLPEPIFTPATKADEGHDENINFDQCAEILGMETASKLRDISIALYNFGAEYLDSKGIILCDTKFEFGTLDDGTLILIDEALTPDSSRFWLKSEWAPGREVVNFDKQVLRDYLETLTWDKQPPAPKLPKEIIDKALSKYKLAYDMIVG